VPKKSGERYIPHKRGGFFFFREKNHPLERRFEKNVGETYEGNP